MKYCTLVLVSLLLVNVCWAFGNCKSLVQIEARQGEGSSWKTNHVHHQIYDVHITNIGNEDIEAVYAFFPSGWRFELEQGHVHAVDAHNTLGGEIETPQPVLLSETLLDPFAQEPLQFHEPYVSLEDFAPADEVPSVVQELLIPDPLAALDVLPELPLLPVDTPFVVYDPLPETLYVDVSVLPEAHEAREVRSLPLWPHGEGVITQVWNYDVETGEILNFGGVIASGNTWSGAGFVVVGDAIPHFAFVKAFCSRHCVNVHKADHPVVLSEQVVVLSTDPVVAAYDTPVPFHHLDVAPRFESCSTRYTGNYHAIAFSPNTGRYANATSTRGYPIEEALDLCGEWNKADDCVILLACIDCFSAISVTDGPVDGHYLASVATGVSDYQAEDLAREQCACLAAGTEVYCL